MERNKFSIRKKNCRTFEKNNITISFNILHSKKENIYPAYVSKNGSNSEKQVTPLMIPNRENGMILQ